MRSYELVNPTFKISLLQEWSAEKKIGENREKDWFFGFSLYFFAHHVAEKGWQFWKGTLAQLQYLGLSPFCTRSRDLVIKSPPLSVFGSAYPMYGRLFLPVAAFHSPEHLTTAYLSFSASVHRPQKFHGLSTIKICDQAHTKHARPIGLAAICWIVGDASHLWSNKFKTSERNSSSIYSRELVCSPHLQKKQIHIYCIGQIQSLPWKLD